MQALEQKQDFATFDDVQALAADDMGAVDRLISASLASDVALVSQVSEYIVMSGGKRLRPMIVLLASRAFGYEGRMHFRAAAIIEFIHTATLLHEMVKRDVEYGIVSMCIGGGMGAAAIFKRDV